MENGSKPPRLTVDELRSIIKRYLLIIEEMLDDDLFPWLVEETAPKQSDVEIATSVVADRLMMATADPVMRQEQEHRQFRTLTSFLESHGYTSPGSGTSLTLERMVPGSYAYHVNVPVKNPAGHRINMPIDVVVCRRSDRTPLLIECKSAGDYANTNKRRKEEAAKMQQLRTTYGHGVSFILYLSGYFDTSYLGYEAAEGLDWVWEHRTSDLLKCGL